MTIITDWCRHGELKQWIQIEQLLSGMELRGLPWCQKNLPGHAINHPTVGETWRIAQKTFREHLIAPIPSPLTPVIGNPDFSPGLSDPRFQSLNGSDRYQLHQFTSNGKWRSRENIMEDPLLTNLSFWQKLQLAHFIRSQPPPAPFERTLTSFELLCTEQEPVRHTISLTYQLLVTPPKRYRPSYITKWERDGNTANRETSGESNSLYV